MVHWVWLIISSLASAAISVVAIAILTINRDRQGYERGYRQGVKDGFGRHTDPAQGSV